ncbi:MAG: beta-lactamase family protein [Thermoplasmata archaeon]|nr:beta-lactamase family protein [Thermoplasmata archaeon]
MIDFKDAFKALDEYYIRKTAADNVPGMALAMTDREHTLHSRSMGYSDLASKAKVTDETLFQIGSISKSFTDIALLQLVERGRLDLHAPVTDYLPWFEVKSKHPPITLHHLMTHTAGIPMGTESTVAAESEVWALREAEASAPPGEFFHYSNTGYKALGLVLEAVTGTTCSDAVMKAVIEPLGMTRTYASITNALRKATAVGYTWLHDDRLAGRKAELAAAVWSESTSADGSISSVSEDMASFVRMLLKHGTGPRGRIITEESFELLTNRYITPLDGYHGESYGYGLNIEDNDGHQFVWHTGGMVGYTSSMLMDMDLGIGIIILTNSLSGPDDMSRHSIQVMRAAAEQKPLPEAVIDPHAHMPKNPERYAGIYEGDRTAISISVKDRLLAAEVNGETVVLEGLREDQFLLDHPDFNRFPLRFVRIGDDITGLVHGSDSYSLEPRAIQSTVPKTPQAWKAFVGHYRSHNSWMSNIRVVLRGEELAYIDPSVGEEPLVSLPDGSFRIGGDPRSPERIRFDMIIGGKAFRACLLGGCLHRSFVE